MKNKKWSKTGKIEKDQTKLYLKAFDLIHEALHACIVRDLVKEFRYERAERLRTYNVIATFSHVALENYAIQQLWKLFDKNNSVFNVWHVVENMPHPGLKEWFKVEINKIKGSLRNLEVWRQNFVGHRSEEGHLVPNEIEQKFPNRNQHEIILKDFLIDLLCQMKFEMQGKPTENTKKNLLEGLQGYKRFVIDDKGKIFKSYNLIKK